MDIIRIFGGIVLVVFGCCFTAAMIIGAVIFVVEIFKAARRKK